jgi:hypothetical protein
MKYRFVYIKRRINKYVLLLLYLAGIIVHKFICQVFYYKREQEGNIYKKGDSLSYYTAV